MAVLIPPPLRTATPGAAQTVGDGLSDSGRGSGPTQGPAGAVDSATVGGYKRPSNTDFSRFPEPFKSLASKQAAEDHKPVQ